MLSNPILSGPERDTKRALNVIQEADVAGRSNWREILSDWTAETNPVVRDLDVVWSFLWRLHPHK